MTDDYDVLVETVAILSDPELLALIKVGLVEVEASETVSLEETARALQRPGK